MFSIWFPFDRSHKGCDLNTFSEITHQIKGRQAQPRHIQTEKNKLCVLMCEWWSCDFTREHKCLNFGFFVTENTCWEVMKKLWKFEANISGRRKHQELLWLGLFMNIVYRAINSFRLRMGYNKWMAFRNTPALFHSGIILEKWLSTRTNMATSGH